MERNVHAIVLRRVDAGESDRRITLLTREEGVLDVYVRGARKAGAKLSSITEPLSVSMLQVASSRKWNHVRQAQPVSSFPGLRYDYDRLMHGLALAELAAAVLPHGKPAEDEFGFMVGAIKYLEVHEKPLAAAVWAQLKLMSLAGFGASFDRCIGSGDAVGEAEAWLSPEAGGYVSPETASRYPDRFLARAETLYVLAACAPLSTPPPALRFAPDALRALYPFWIRYAERNGLPALEAALASLP